MPDQLIIHDLAVECRLGVFEWEQERPQTIWVDLELAIDAARAAVQDDVRQTIDYAQLVTSVKLLAQQKPYRLLETLAEAIASRILMQCDAPRVKVHVKKRALPGIDYAAVEVERTATRPRRPARAAASGRRRLIRVGRRR